MTVSTPRQQNPINLLARQIVSISTDIAQSTAYYQFDKGYQFLVHLLLEIKQFLAILLFYSERVKKDEVTMTGINDLDEYNILDKEKLKNIKLLFH